MHVVTQLFKQYLGTTQEKLVNNLPLGSWFTVQAFLLFSQHPVSVYHAGKLIENMVNNIALVRQ